MCHLQQATLAVGVAAVAVLAGLAGFAAFRRTAEGKWRVTWRKTTGLVGGRCDAA